MINIQENKGMFYNSPQIICEDIENIKIDTMRFLSLFSA